MIGFETDFNVFLQMLIARTFKKHYSVDNVVVQVDIDELATMNFTAKTFNDDYTRVATYGGYVQRDASGIIITKVNGHYLTKMIETQNEIRFIHNFIQLSI